MGIGHEHLVDEILFVGAHPGAALAAAALRPIGRQRHPFDVAGVGHRDHHVFALDQVFDIVLKLAFLDDGTARVGEFLLPFQQLLAKQRIQFFPGPQQRKVAGDFLT